VCVRVWCLQQTRESWQNVFYVTAAVYTFGAIAYCILASGCIQSWAVAPEVLRANATRVVEVELKCTDTLLDPYEQKSSSVPQPASKQDTRSGIKVEALLPVSS